MYLSLILEICLSVNPDFFENELSDKIIVTELNREFAYTHDSQNKGLKKNRRDPPSQPSQPVGGYGR